MYRRLKDVHIFIDLKDDKNVMTYSGYSQFNTSRSKEYFDKTYGHIRTAIFISKPLGRQKMRKLGMNLISDYPHTYKPLMTHRARFEIGYQIDVEIHSTIAQAIDAIYILYAIRM